jgi:hypothetical protein
LGEVAIHERNEHAKLWIEETKEKP